MNYRIIVTRNFEKQLKRLHKKFPSLKQDLEKLGQRLLNNPHTGISLGKNAYKIRLAVKSKGKGKRGGMRIITYLEIDILIDELTNVYLLTIYDKSETASITGEELKQLIENSIR